MLRIVVVPVLAFAFLSAASAADRLRLPNPWKELVRPNCAGDDCRAGDYAEHKRRLKQEERQKQEEEKAAADRRRRETCARLGGSGTAHTTKQC